VKLDAVPVLAVFLLFVLGPALGGAGFPSLENGVVGFSESAGVVEGGRYNGMC